MKDIKIAVAYHKESIVIANECYLPIQVGKSIHPEIDLGLQPDNTGENISSKNDFYCELTALYWLWKNVKADYKGLCHYRRFFSDRRDWAYLFYKLVRPFQSLRGHLFANIPGIVYRDENLFREEALSALTKIDRLLDNHEIICPLKVVENRGSYWHFVVYGKEIMDLLRCVIKESYPSYYGYISYVEEPSSFYFGNMSIMRNELFEEYCSFLFGVLAELENRLVSENWYKDLHAERIFSRKLGYFGEYLTDLFIRKKEDEVNVCKMSVAILRN